MWVGAIWYELQLVTFPLPEHFEVLHDRRIVRVEFTDEPHAFARRVSLAVIRVVSVPVVCVVN
jgi:hypothetical protein